LTLGFLCCKKEEAVIRSTESKIREFSQGWIGTPYKLGGTTHEGIDCSALTQKLYLEVFNVELPRRVVDQRVEGLQVHRDSMQAGDLVVFRGSLFGRPHIGVYISKDDFLHASSSKGVTISNLSEHYWKRKFRFGRRLIDARGRMLVAAD
jgi:lipoprotein Spr